MRRSLPSSAVANTLGFLRDALLCSTCGYTQSWNALPFTHSLGLTLLGAGTVGALLLLRQLSQPRPSHSSPEIDPSQFKVPGLSNSGNNCFLNAILQALASSDAVLSFLATYSTDKIPPLYDGGERSYLSFPLTEAISDLLAELSELDCEPRIASPHQVMLALEPYAKQFDLSLQQDAAEALNYLAHALQEERIALFKSIRSHRESMSDASKMSIGAMTENGQQKESSPLNSWKKWPLEGTMGSSLVCQECGYKFSTQFESFHEVLLSPPQLSNGNILTGCTLEDCLRRYSAPECVANVYCSCCSHLLAVRLLQSRNDLDKDLLQRIKRCAGDDDCPCEQLVMQLGGSWQKVYVKAIKQLRFGCCPEVLCCQVQRVIVGSFGDLVKWTGHVSFPFVLNLQPFVMSSQGCFGKLLVPSQGSDMVRDEWQSNMERINFKVVSTDGSSSDDVHMSGNEDMSSDTSSESTAGRSVEEIVEQHKDKDNSATVLWDDSNPLESMTDAKKYGLDAVLCPKFGGGYMPFYNDNDQLCFKFPELRDDISCFKPLLQNFLWSNLSMNDAFPLSAAMSSPAALRQKLHCDEVDRELVHINKKWRYELISVVVHHGSSKSGHYTVYRKAKLKESDFARRVYQADIHHSEATDCNDSKLKCTNVDAHISRENVIPHDNVLQSSNAEALPESTPYAVGSESEDVCRKVVANVDCRRNLSNENLMIDSATGHENVNGTVSPPMHSLITEVLPINDALEVQNLKRQTEDDVVLWFRVSDSNVTLVKEEDVLMAQGTLLFYQRLQ